jgi:uncharacterized protein GlcG (DUF336 family)
MVRTAFEEVDVKTVVISGIVTGLTLSLLVPSYAQQQAPSVPARKATVDLKATRDIKVISSAGARALADACSAWAEQNKQIVAIAILDWGGNLIESHAMEGAPMNAIDTALLKAKSALRWRRPTSETNKMVRSGENLAPTFMNDFPQPGALPVVVNGQVIGAMGCRVPNFSPLKANFRDPRRRCMRSRNSRRSATSFESLCQESTIFEVSLGTTRWSADLRPLIPRSSVNRSGSS